jgi:hypothetical protein
MYCKYVFIIIVFYNTIVYISFYRLTFFNNNNNIMMMMMMMMMKMQDLSFKLLHQMFPHYFQNRLFISTDIDRLATLIDNNT